MSEAMSGHIIGGPADPEYDGSPLTAALAIGATILTVEDTADFDERAAEHDGHLLIGVDLDADGLPDSSTGTRVAYRTCYNEDGVALFGVPSTQKIGTPNTIELLDPSPVAADAGDVIYIENPVSGLPVGQAEVMVAMDDGDTTGDPLTAILSLEMFGSVGTVDLTGQAVGLVEDPDDGQLIVSSLPGLAQASGDVKFMQDPFTVTVLGDQTFTLTYRPKKNSEHVYWHPVGGAGIYQDGSQWSRDQWDITIPDPGGLIQVGDEFVVEYAYTDPTTKPGAGSITVDIPATIWSTAWYQDIGGSNTQTLVEGGVSQDASSAALPWHILETNDGDTNYLAYASVVGTGSPGDQDYIYWLEFPATAISGTMTDVALVVVSKGDPTTGTVYPVIDFNYAALASPDSAAWAIPVGSAGWVEQVIPLTPGAAALSYGAGFPITQAQIEAGAFHDAGAGGIDVMLTSRDPSTGWAQAYTYLALRVTYTP